MSVPARTPPLAEARAAAAPARRHLQFLRALAVVLLLVGTGVALASSFSRGSSDPYAFELVEREVKQGYGTTILVRLVDERTGKVVPDAVLFISRIDMSPDGMAAMTAPLELQADTMPGYYRFETDLSMEGAWALTLAAKIPGLPNPIQRRLVLQAVP
ncbi:FixH family protein [Methylobacterium isbiliense]|uniref:FixH family protein n=1 Tax=Methylobacterium isbiliense TaxID=315478 RepID=UPI001EE2B9F6|nr:FixH family protein [Methylobacterium isbiliense]